MNFTMKTEIEHLLDLLTCQFLRIFFLNCPQQASPIPILIFGVPPLPIFSFTKSFKIFSTSQKICRFSYPATCHLPPDTFQGVAPDFRVDGDHTLESIYPYRKPGSSCRTAGYSYCKAGYSYCTAGSPGFPAKAPGRPSTVHNNIFIPP